LSPACNVSNDKLSCALNSSAAPPLFAPMVPLCVCLIGTVRLIRSTWVTVPVSASWAKAAELSQNDLCDFHGSFPVYHIYAISLGGSCGRTQGVITFPTLASRSRNSCLGRRNPIDAALPERTVLAHWRPRRRWQLRRLRLRCVLRLSSGLGRRGYPHRLARRGGSRPRRRR
jgi:hypothetical protein